MQTYASSLPRGIAIVFDLYELTAVLDLACKNDANLSSLETLNQLDSEPLALYCVLWDTIHGSGRAYWLTLSNIDLFPS